MDVKNLTHTLQPRKKDFRKPCKRVGSVPSRAPTGLDPAFPLHEERDADSALEDLALDVDDALENAARDAALQFTMKEKRFRKRFGR